jgi:hypothetical protein
MSASEADPGAPAEPAPEGGGDLEAEPEAEPESEPEAVKKNVEMTPAQLKEFLQKIPYLPDGDVDENSVITKYFLSKLKGAVPDDTPEDEKDLVFRRSRAVRSFSCLSVFVL